MKPVTFVVKDTEAYVIVGVRVKHPKQDQYFEHQLQGEWKSKLFITLLGGTEMEVQVQDPVEDAKRIISAFLSENDCEVVTASYRVFEDSYN